MRNISASLTKEQIRKSVELVRAGKAPVKDVTRRHGWKNLKVGQRLQVCEKCQGLKPGEPLVRICVIEVVSVRREPLGHLTRHLETGVLETVIEGAYFDDEAQLECVREGFPEMSPSQFVAMFCATHKGCTPETEITRIEFKYIV